MQMNYLETPINMILISNVFEVKTTTCLIWQPPVHKQISSQLTSKLKSMSLNQVA